MHKIKNDKYKKIRGGKSKILALYCSNCENQILIYQKDGPGTLKRLYIDRIIVPQKKLSKDNKQLNLICNQCKNLIGYPKIYKKENRQSFQLIPGIISKKIIQ
jgi:ribosomal protein S27E